MSKKQIKQTALAFEKLSRSREFLSVNTAVNILLYSLEKPFGFTAWTGDLKQDTRERKIRKLIRAELNLILREHLYAAKVTKSPGTFSPVNPAALLKKTKVTISDLLSGPARYSDKACSLVNGVSFKEFVMTLTFWRSPNIIPESIRQQRKQKIQHIVLMACALTVADFLRSAVARSKKKILNTANNKILNTEETQNTTGVLEYSAKSSAVSTALHGVKCSYDRCDQLSSTPTNGQHKSKKEVQCNGNTVSFVGGDLPGYSSAICSDGTESEPCSLPHYDVSDCAGASILIFQFPVTKQGPQPLHIDGATSSSPLRNPLPLLPYKELSDEVRVVNNLQEPHVEHSQIVYKQLKHPRRRLEALPSARPSLGGFSAYQNSSAKPNNIRPTTTVRHLRYLRPLPLSHWSRDAEESGTCSHNHAQSDEV